MAQLSKAEIRRALEKLGELAHQQGFAIELILVGGAAMVLRFDARQATQDVDALVLPPPAANIVRSLAYRVAQDLNLHEDWLNDGAKGYLMGISDGPIVFQGPGISARIPSVAQLLAMKLSAWRDDVDIADAQRLLIELEGTQATIWAAVQPYLVPGKELKAQYAFLDLWEVLHDEN